MRESIPTTQIDPSDAPQRQTLTRALKSAADATGIAFDYLLAQASQESGLDPKADNPHSSAAGLFQFTQSTWIEMIHRHGAAAGLDSYAEAIQSDGHGHLHITDPQIRQKILALRHDPKVSARIAAEYAKDNKRYLETHLGRAVSGHDLYLAHFLGAAGALKVLERKDHSPRRSASGLLPDAAQANPTIFQDPRSHKPRTVAALYKAVQAHYNRALSQVAQLTPRPEPASASAAAPTGSSRPKHHPSPSTSRASATDMPPIPTPRPAAEPNMSTGIETITTRIAKLETDALSPPRPANPFYPVELPPDPSAAPRKT